MKRGKALPRLQRRQKAWDAIGYPSGFKRPGSLKKPHAEGKTARASRRFQAERRMAA